MTCRFLQFLLYFFVLGSLSSSSVVLGLNPGLVLGSATKPALPLLVGSVDRSCGGLAFTEHLSRSGPVRSGYEWGSESVSRGQAAEVCTAPFTESCRSPRPQSRKPWKAGCTTHVSSALTALCSHSSGFQRTWGVSSIQQSGGGM